MSSFHHNKEISNELRSENEQYNNYFVRDFDLVGSETVAIDSLDVSDDEKTGAAPYMLVWLKNIDRLLSMVPDTISMDVRFS